MTALYPVFLKLDGLPVVVVGGGTVAASKLDGLLAAGAHVTVVAPQIAPRSATRVALVEPRFAPATSTARAGSSRRRRPRSTARSRRGR